MSKDHSSSYKNYTTSTLIQLMKDNEFGSATGRSRQLTFWVNGKPYHALKLDGWGDGLVTDVGVYLKSDEQIAKMKAKEL